MHTAELQKALSAQKKPISGGTGGAAERERRNRRLLVVATIAMTVLAIILVAVAATRGSGKKQATQADEVAGRAPVSAAPGAQATLTPIGGDQFLPEAQSTNPEPSPAPGVKETPTLPAEYLQAPESPSGSNPQGSPPAGIAGRYQTSFELFSNPCVPGALSSKHDIVLRFEGGELIVEDTLLSSTLRGAAGPDGYFRVTRDVAHPQATFQEVMEGRVGGGEISGSFWRFSTGCTIQYKMAGSRTG